MYCEVTEEVGEGEVYGVQIQNRSLCDAPVGTETAGIELTSGIYQTVSHVSRWRFVLTRS